MPYLDGKQVLIEEISAEKHRYVGMYRPPSYTQLLPEGCSLYTGYRVHELWLHGNFDEPMYVSISPTQRPFVKPKTLLRVLANLRKQVDHDLRSNNKVLSSALPLSRILALVLSEPEVDKLIRRRAQLLYEFRPDSLEDAI